MEFKNLLISEMNLALQHKDDQGGWDITWSWNDYDSEFQVAKKSWRAIICLNYAVIMKKLGIL